MINIFFVLLGSFSIILVFQKVKSKLFSEKESFFWMINSIIILLLSVFPKALDNLSFFLGISYPPSLLFLISILFLILIVFRQTQQISILNERVKELAQSHALLDEKVTKIIEKSTK